MKTRMKMVMTAHDRVNGIGIHQDWNPRLCFERSIQVVTKTRNKRISRGFHPLKTMR